MLTGCSQAGICNIIEYAKEISGVYRIQAVIGGFHLKCKDKQTEETIHFLKKQGIKNILLSHCTELSALPAIYEVFGSQGIKTGITFES